MLSKVVWGLCLLTSLAEGLQPAGPGGLTKVRRDIFTRDTPNDFGDPIQGDPVTNINCALGDFGKHHSVFACISLSFSAMLRTGRVN